jgi:hypothetical protein
MSPIVRKARFAVKQRLLRNLRRCQQAGRSEFRRSSRSWSSEHSTPHYCP